MPILRLAVVMLAAGLPLAACGVRGDLEPPPGAEAAAPARQSAAVEVEAPVAEDPAFEDLDEDDGDTTRVLEAGRDKRYPPASDSFVLDPLL